MKSVIEVFKNLVDWVSKKLSKEGVYRTFVSIMLTIIMIIFLTHYADMIIYGVGHEIEEGKFEQFKSH